MKRLAGLFLAALLAFAPFVQADLRASSTGAASSVTAAAFPLLAPDGTNSAPSYSFTSQAAGLFITTSSRLGFTVGGTFAGQLSNGGLILPSTSALFFGSDATQAPGLDTVLLRDAANTLAMKNGASAQTFRLYNTTTGPIHTAMASRTAGIAFTQTGGAMQMSAVQTTPPTVTANGGTSPVCVGSDTAMACTIGTAPPAAATFTITFNGTWGAAPSCTAIRGTTGTTPAVLGVVSATTTLVVNLSANLVASERYNIQCMGVS